MELTPQTRFEAHPSAPRQPTVRFAPGARTQGFGAAMVRSVGPVHSLLVGQDAVLQMSVTLAFADNGGAVQINRPETCFRRSLAAAGRTARYNRACGIRSNRPHSRHHGGRVLGAEEAT